MRNHLEQNALLWTLHLVLAMVPSRVIWTKLEGAVLPPVQSQALLHLLAPGPVRSLGSWGWSCRGAPKFPSPSPPLAGSH